MLQLQLHENATQLKNWAKGDHLPKGATLSSVSILFNDDTNRVLTLNDPATNLPLGIFVDECHGLLHTIRPVFWDASLQGEVKLDAFKEYSKDRCYLEAFLLLPPGLVKAVYGKIRYRIWVPEKAPLGRTLTNFNLYIDGMWKMKLDLVEGHPDLNLMLIRTYGFAGTEYNMVSARLKQLGFKRTATAFVI
ncbi:hypothetical protein STRATTON_198 [Erwinia phage vB_EamM_Stratton]|uniref:Uncharacterized protein n=2 Tax=Erskinevirus EaH2 TaxID=2169883 RepID=A0A1B2IHB8_9CAUD|nr:hypothetical protein G173_gp101 [Erwinia phage phiEaH2]AFQ96646.1 hypothetical protein [Erwinia phage phiEaH2]ANZ50623.1 hypothetical protein STRATTON_198 [Erwinia phage vB_EamM_Stratton]